MVYLQLPANLNFRYLAVRAVAALCRSLGQPVEFGDAVMSAVGEAFNNAVLHAHQPASHSTNGQRQVQLRGPIRPIESSETIESSEPIESSGPINASEPIDSSEPVEIELEVDAERGALEIRVFDYGQGFCLTEVETLDLDALCVEDFPESGMGLHIIRALMSDTAYQQGRPNVLFMRKTLPRPLPPLRDP